LVLIKLAYNIDKIIERYSNAHALQNFNAADCIRVELDQTNITMVELPKKMPE
jgi:cysteinyl-tRNA synthetase